MVLMSTSMLLPPPAGNWVLPPISGNQPYSVAANCHSSEISCATTQEGVSPARARGHNANDTVAALRFRQVGVSAGSLPMFILLYSCDLARDSPTARNDVPAASEEPRRSSPRDARSLRCRNP